MQEDDVDLSTVNNATLVERADSILQDLDALTRKQEEIEESLIGQLRSIQAQQLQLRRERARIVQEIVQRLRPTEVIDVSSDS
jgi:hypothetical protein